MGKNIVIHPDGSYTYASPDDNDATDPTNLSGNYHRGIHVPHVIRAIGVVSRTLPLPAPPGINFEDTCLRRFPRVRDTTSKHSGKEFVDNSGFITDDYGQIGDDSETTTRGMFIIGYLVRDIATNKYEIVIYIQRETGHGKPEKYSPWNTNHPVIT